MSPPELIGGDGPTARYRRERRDHRESHSHADDHWQTASDEGPVRLGENEWKHGQDARARDREHAAEISEQE